MKKRILALLCFLVIGINLYSKPCMTTSVGFGGFENFANQAFDFGGTQAINNTIPLLFEFNWSWAESNTYNSDGQSASFDGSGIMVKTGYTAVNKDNENKSVSFLIGVGYNQYYKAHKTYSPLYDKAIYVQEDSPDYKIELSGGLLVNINKFLISFEFDNARGLILGIGAVF